MTQNTTNPKARHWPVFALTEAPDTKPPIYMIYAVFLLTLCGSQRPAKCPLYPQTDCFTPQREQKKPNKRTSGHALRLTYINLKLHGPVKYSSRTQAEQLRPF